MHGALQWLFSVPDTFPVEPAKKTKQKRLQDRDFLLLFFLWKKATFLLPPTSAIVSVSAGIRVYLSSEQNQTDKIKIMVESLLHHARGMLLAISACLGGRVAVLSIWEIYISGWTLTLLPEVALCQPDCLQLWVINFELQEIFKMPASFVHYPLQ